MTFTIFGSHRVIHTFNLAEAIERYYTGDWHILFSLLFVFPIFVQSIQRQHTQKLVKISVPTFFVSRSEIMVSLFRRKKMTENDQSSRPITPSNDTQRSSKNRPKESAETTVFQVKIPPNIKPGDEFQVYGKTIDMIYFLCLPISNLSPLLFFLRSGPRVDVL